MIRGRKHHLNAVPIGGENVAWLVGYNREKDRTTIEETFRRLVELVNSLDEEQEARGK
jgi:hypothetical protein